MSRVLFDTYLLIRASETWSEKCDSLSTCLKIIQNYPKWFVVARGTRHILYACLSFRSWSFCAPSAAYEYATAVTLPE